IWIDRDAAGTGWFIDATPWEASEFQGGFADHELRAAPGSPAFGKMDLLTVLEHELGHVLGLDDGDESEEVMGAFLGGGVRRILQPRRGGEAFAGGPAGGQQVTGLTHLLAYHPGARGRDADPRQRGDEPLALLAQNRRALPVQPGAAFPG